MKPITQRKETGTKKIDLRKTEHTLEMMVPLNSSSILMKIEKLSKETGGRKPNSINSQTNSIKVM